MEQIGGAATATRFRRQHHHNPAERFLGTLQPQTPSAAPPIELSEDDIFSTPSGSSPPSATYRKPVPDPSASRSIHRDQFGISSILNGNIKSRSVFNRKASAAASLSSSSASPATPISSRIMIPRPPQPQEDRFRVYHQSAPVNIPAMPKALRRAKEFEDAASEGEEEDDDGVRLPPHVVASRNSPMLSCSVLEGSGRTLKGRDLRQVRNAIWRKTGFID